MTLLEPAAPPADSAKESLVGRLANFVTKTAVIAELEARKLRHDPTELVIRSIQPALWLLIFGQVFARIRGIPTGDIGYLDFLTPGILAQSVLFVAIFSGMTILWERDLGVIHKFLVSPTPRAALVLGKGLSSAIKSLPQMVLILLLSLALVVRLNPGPLALLGVMATVVLGAICFSTFSLLIACTVKSRERFMGIGQLLTMPLFFASNAIYPVALMPVWLQGISHLNPLTYMVDALRGLLLQAGSYPIGLDLGILLGVTVLLVTLCAHLYPNLVR